MSEPKHIYPAYPPPSNEPTTTPLANHRENRIEDLRAALLRVAETGATPAGLQEYVLDVLMWDDAYEMNRIHDAKASERENSW